MRASVTPAAALKEARDWLETNKVFFEIPVALLLGLMALRLTCASNQLLARQVAADEAASRPVFVISRANRGGPWGQELLEIANAGHYAENVRCRVYAFLSFLGPPTATSTFHSVQVPLPNYFTCQSSRPSSRATKGTVAVYKADWGMWRQAVNEAVHRGDGAPGGFWDVEVFVRIEYTDIRGAQASFCKVELDGSNLWLRSHDAAIVECRWLRGPRILEPRQDSILRECRAAVGRKHTKRR